MFSLKQILQMPPTPPRVHVRGEHNDRAESFRDRTLSALTRLYLLGMMLEAQLREKPDDDAGFESVVAMLFQAQDEAGEYLEAFRQVRSVQGEA